MARWWRWTLALLLCGVGAVVFGPVSASAAPAVSAGLGTVVADLGVTPQDDAPGFSFDGSYYAYQTPAVGDRCDLHLYDVAARKAVGLAHAHVTCGSYQVHWAAHADSLEWQTYAFGDDLTLFAWDADRGQVSPLAGDAQVFQYSGFSADGRYLAFVGRSDSHPAPGVDGTRDAGYVYDRTTGMSLPLSKPEVHVSFVSWSPAGDHFVAWAGDQTTSPGVAGCVGSGTSCRVLTDPIVESGSDLWSRDGTAVILTELGSKPLVYDVTDDSVTPFPIKYGVDGYSFFVGVDARYVVGYRGSGAALWDRRTGRVSSLMGPSGVWASVTGDYLLYRGEVPETYRYHDLATGADAPATYRGTRYSGSIDGYWAKDGSSYLGVGPGGCSSLRQWSPATNTVSLFGPPGLKTCYDVPRAFESDPLPSSASGRFGVAYKTGAGGGRTEYVVDLRRHVLLGPLDGAGTDFAPAGSELLAVYQPFADGTARLLLVDPTPVPDVDDKPRWSTATPASGTTVQVAPGGQVHVQLGASDLQKTPVNLDFRWRDTSGNPIASAPKGWSCDRKRLAAGATVAECTFAPPASGFTPARFLDVSVTNYVTGAQSDTRSYRITT